MIHRDTMQNWWYAFAPLIISREGRRLDELWMPQSPFRLGTFHGFHWSPLGSTQDGKRGGFWDFFKVCKWKHVGSCKMDGYRTMIMSFQSFYCQLCGHQAKAAPLQTSLGWHDLSSIESTIHSRFTKVVLLWHFFGLGRLRAYDCELHVAGMGSEMVRALGTRFVFWGNELRHWFLKPKKWFRPVSLSHWTEESDTPLIDGVDQSSVNMQ